MLESITPLGQNARVNGGLGNETNSRIVQEAVKQKREGVE
jgi:hypothetical protein